MPVARIDELVVESAYQLIVVAPLGIVAASKFVPFPHRAESLLEITLEGDPFTVAITAVLLDDKHVVVVFLASA